MDTALAVMEQFRQQVLPFQNGETLDPPWFTP